MDLRSEAPVTVVTGAAGGIGRAVVRRLLEQGHRVVGVVHTDDSGNELARTLAKSRLTIVACDIATADGRRKIIDTVSTRHGAVTGLVNNAGIGMSSIRRDYYKSPIGLNELNAGIISRFMAVNAEAPIALSLELLPWFNRGWGRIVNMGTSLTAMLRPAFLPYAMSKAALESASAVLANDLDGTGITVNIVNPGGPVDTPMARRDEPELRATLIPADVIARPAAWLASPASSSIHGRRLTATRWQGPDAELQTDPIGWPQLKGDSTWLTPYKTGKDAI